MKKTKLKLRVAPFAFGSYCIEERVGGCLFWSWRKLEEPILGSNFPLSYEEYEEACKEAERLLEGDNLQKLKDSLYKKTATKPIRYFG